jgi:hypothetical protein
MDEDQGVKISSIEVFFDAQAYMSTFEEET